MSDYIDDELIEEEENDSINNDPKYEEVITKKGMTFMTKIVLFSIAFIIVYTIWTQVAVIKWGITPNDILTEWIYKFFGLEITLMCLKRIMDKRLTKKKLRK